MTDQNDAQPPRITPVSGPGPAPEAENEVLRAARAAKEQQDRAMASDKSRTGWKKAAAAGLGIGSAALLAAVLYSRRDKD